MSRSKNFTKSEDQYIKDNYRDLFDDEIAEHLNRPEGSVTRRRQRLGCWYVQCEAGPSLKGEIWSQITGLPEGYMISNMGRVKSGNKLVALYVNSQGYVQWRLVNRGTGLRRSFKLHRLVAEHFCDNFSPDLDVHHIDHNPTNNRYDNLLCLTAESHRELHRR